MSSFRRHPLGSAFTVVPPATLTILLLCIVLWFVETATVASWSTAWRHVELSVPGLLSGKVWQLVTYQFLHAPGSLTHVLFNMLTLIFFAPRLERRWGTAGFVRFFLACGIGGGLLYFVVALLLRDPGGVVGASGALLGVLLACAMIWPHDQIILLVIPVQLRFAVLIIGLVDLMMAWTGAMGGSATGAVAHVGGALTGWAYLAHAHRVRALFKGGRGNPWQSARRWWRRRRMHVADRDFDQWLKDQDDKTRH